MMPTIWSLPNCGVLLEVTDAEDAVYGKSALSRNTVVQENGEVSSVATKVAEVSVNDSTAVPAATSKKTDLVSLSEVPDAWVEDLELLSRFVDKRTALKLDHLGYLQGHPEVNQMLADFTELVLLKRPQNVIMFAADYFSRLSST
eukprot:Clim_evm73s218 gene=Clim_evmTU73s218